MVSLIVAVITFLFIYFDTGEEYTSIMASLDSLHNIVFLNQILLMDSGIQHPDWGSSLVTL